jgi:acetate kinase
MIDSPSPTTLVINAGSSSIKAAVYDGGDPCLEAHVDLRDEAVRLVVRPRDGEEYSEQIAGSCSWQAALDLLFDHLLTATNITRITAVGHRIVHGGTHFTAPTVVTPTVLATLDTLVPLAPLHQPQGLAALRTAIARLPNAWQVACFDTAFHHTCPPEAMRFAIPRPLHDAGIRRYGFHGLSYESVTGQLPTVTGSLPERAIIAHLGAGASLCAIRDGRSIATTMGFTPLDGLVMATRCGSLDPGVVLHLAEQQGMSAADIARLLSRESGLLGVSGISGDMRRLLASDDPRAAEAIDLFCYRAIREIGSLVAALGGLDTLVFTAGIGEHAAAIRHRIAAGLTWLSLDLDAAANATHGPRISTPASRIATWVIPTDEQAVIAHHARAFTPLSPAALDPGMRSQSRS